MFDDWLMEQGMGMETRKRVFATVSAIVNLSISEEDFGLQQSLYQDLFPREWSESETPANTHPEHQKYPTSLQVIG